MVMTETHRLNEGLIGVSGGASGLATPALVIDRPALERNIAAMARFARHAGVALRPHAKTHKSAAIAALQREAGAVGICVAKLGEAEALAAKGVRDLLITSPVVAPAAVARLAALFNRAPETMVVIDSTAALRAAADAAAAAGTVVSVLLDLDIGLGRTGVAPGNAAALAAAIARDPGLSLAGVQAYAGHLQHIESGTERRAKATEARDVLAATVAHLKEGGHAVAIVSGAGTGTFDLDGGAGVYTELQAGSYVFMDRQYNDVWTKDGQKPPFETSLFVQTGVISANRARLATTDAGLKAFAADAGAPAIASGAPDGSAYFFFGDEQGGVLLPEGACLAPGAVLRCVVPHCDPTVNLYDAYCVVDGGTLIDIWPVDARGRSQ